MVSRFFKKILSKKIVTTSQSQVCEMRIAVCLRRELQKVIFRWKIIGKKVVEFGRRNACLNDVFVVLSIGNITGCYFTIKYDNYRP